MTPMIIAAVLVAAAFGIVLPTILERIVENKCTKIGEAVPTPAPWFRVASRIASPLLLGSCAFFALKAAVLPTTLELMIASVLLICIAYIDQRIHIVPNELTLVYLVITLAFRLFDFSVSGLLLHAAGAVLALLLFFLAWLLTGRGTVGAGDVKLAVVIGLSVGFPSVVYALLFASLSFGSIGLTGMLLRKLSSRSKLPFAGFLMLGAVLAQVFQIYGLI